MCFGCQLALICLYCDLGRKDGRSRRRRGGKRNQSQGQGLASVLGAESERRNALSLDHCTSKCAGENKADMCVGMQGTHNSNKNMIEATAVGFKDKLDFQR